MAGGVVDGLAHKGGEVEGKTAVFDVDLQLPRRDPEPYGDIHVFDLFIGVFDNVVEQLVDRFGELVGSLQRQQGQQMPVGLLEDGKMVPVCQADLDEVMHFPSPSAPQAP